jgi:rhamnosyltransferase
MKSSSLCAVVITFQPAAEVVQNLAKVRSQVAALVVVDNGSPADLLAPIRAASQQLHFTLIEHGGNLGIAAALNTGVRWAREQGFAFVILFDQDSTVTEGFCQAMLAERAAHPQRDKLAVVTPTQVEKSTGQVRPHSCASDGGPLVAITSGSLMATEIFDYCGWFQENLIIDCVDHEYCLRARSMGFTLAECRRAVLQVAVGSASEHQAFGYTIQARHYNATRRYYMTRNRLVIVQRFWRQHPGWCCRTLQDVVQDAIKVLLVEQDTWSKMRNTARGIYDAFSGRLGKVVEL